MKITLQFLLTFLAISLTSCNKEKNNIEQKDFYPKQYALVNDYEKILSKEQNIELSELLVNFASGSTNKILFLTVSSYNNKISFEDYATDLARKWHIDQNNSGRTILIVFSKKNRKIGISLGKNVTGFLKPQANEIISEKVIPELKKDSYYLGIKTAILEIIKKWG